MSTSLHKPHRRIWHDYYGDIPIDENGITYEIHHINGDHNDNRIENLACVSIDEHYDIHYKQGDEYACRIMRLRICEMISDKPTVPPSKENHPMYGKTHSKEARVKISKNHIDVSGVNNPMYGKTHSEEARRTISEKNKGQGLGVPKSDETRRRMSTAVKLLTCPHCGKSARGNSMKRWHFENCKEKTT